MSTDWSALFAQGRCKALGVPWSEAELKALYELKIPVDFVREGCLTLELYKATQEEVEQQVVATGKRPLRYMNKPELLAEAKDAGIEVTEFVTKIELVHLIESVRKREPKLPAPDAGSQESLGS